MAFSNAPNVIAQSQTALRISTETVPQSVELRKILEVGKVLDVTVKEDRAKGELELELLGKRVPASLPPNAQAGQKLQVKVVDNSDAIILKIISNSSELVPQEAPVEIDSLLRSLLSADTLKGLKLSSFPIASALPDSVMRLLENDGKKSAPPDGLAKIFETLISGKQLVSKETLENPDALRQVLLKVGQKEVLNTLQQATDALKRISKDTLSPEHTEFIKALDSTIQHLLQDPTPLEFSDENLSRGALSRVAISALTQRVPVGVPPKDSLSSPISTLLKTLISFSSLDLSDSPIERELSKFINQLTTELTNLRDKGTTDAQLRDVLSRTTKDLHTKFGKSLITPEPRAIAETIRALKLLENVSQSQEVLNQLNPLVQALGEPALILIPSIIQGLLSKWEVSVRKPFIDPDEDEENRKNKGNPFERISLFLPFPNIGEVQVELAHRKGELLLSLTCAKPEVAEFLRKKLTKLGQHFIDRGYGKTLVTALTGQPKGSTPGWYSEMVKGSVVA